MKRYPSLIVALALLLIASSAVAIQARTKRASNKSNAQVIYTGEIAKKVIGYEGPTPLNIYIENGKIERIEALDNQETPQYFQKAAKKVFEQYQGLTIEQAKALKPDAATGATYTSEALIKNIQMGLEQAKIRKATTGKKRSATHRRW